MASQNRAHVIFCERDRAAELALALADAGLAVIPVHLHQQGGRWLKDPLIKDWRNRASADARTVEGWWRQFPFAVPGIVLARCGLVIVDADRHPGKPDGVAALRALGALPAHPVIATRGGGEHHYFQQPDPPISFARWVGGEVLGTSKFAVAYAMVDPAAVPPLPAGLLGALPRARHHHSSSHPPLKNNMRPTERSHEPGCDLRSHRVQPTLSVPLRSTYLLRGVERAEPGNRNALLHWSACRFGNMVGEGRMLRSVAEQLLVGGAKACGLWREDGEAQCRATIKSGLDAGIEEIAAAEVQQ